MNKSRFKQPKDWLLFGGLIIGVLLTLAVITQLMPIERLQVEVPAGREYGQGKEWEPSRLPVDQGYCLCFCNNGYNTLVTRVKFAYNEEICRNYHNIHPEECSQTFGSSYGMMYCDWLQPGEGPVYLPP